MIRIKTAFKSNFTIPAICLGLILLSFSSCKDEVPVDDMTNLLCDGNGTMDDWPMVVGSQWFYEIIADGETDTTPAKLEVFKKSVFLQKEYFGVESYESVWGIPHYYRVDSTTGDLIFFNPSNSNEYLELPGNPTVGQKWNTYFASREIIGIDVSLSTPSCEYTGLIEVLEKGNSSDRTFYFKKGLGIVRMVTTGGKYSKYELTLKEVNLN